MASAKVKYAMFYMAYFTFAVAIGDAKDIIKTSPSTSLAACGLAIQVAAGSLQDFARKAFRISFESCSTHQMRTVDTSAEHLWIRCDKT